MKDVNIVIVNYNMREKIEKCLSSLFVELNDSNLDVNVVVVDNRPEDGVEELLKNKFPTVDYIRQETNPGFGFSQNLGMKSCKASYYFALNPDTEFQKGQKTIERLFNFMEENPKVGMTGPKLIYPDNSLQYSCWRFPPLFQPFYQRTKLGKTRRGEKKVSYHHMKDFGHDETIPVDAIMGSAMFARKEAVDQVGMFDDRFFMYYEDIDWCRRMWDAGWPVYYVHDIVLMHIHGRGSAKVSGVFRALIRNKLARIHVSSWIKYLWKWRGTSKFYNFS